MAKTRSASKPSAKKRAAVKKPAAKKSASQAKASPKAKPAEVQKRRLRVRLPRRKKYEKRELAAPLSNVYRLFVESVDVLRSHWRLFGGMLLVYVVLSVILVGSLGSASKMANLRDQMEEVSAGSSEGTVASMALFGQMVGSVGSASTEVGSAYQSFILVMMSLAIIWALRQVLAAKPVGVRDAFYKGMTPLVPFILVLFVIGLQLIPMLLGAVIYGIAFNGVAQGFWESLAWGSVVFVLMLATIYMLCSSIFALYIVTLPNMRPMAALRSARGLVRFRRWTVLRKLLFLPFALLIIGVAICMPLLIWATPVAPFVFLLLSMMALFVVHSYIYSLYRELL